MRDVLVLGARGGIAKPNIGDAVVDAFAHEPDDWRGIGYHIEQGGHLPPPSDFSIYEAVVCTLGRALIEPLVTISEDDLHDVLRANLALPLAAAAAYVRAREHGTMVFVGSYAHDHVLSNSTPYCAAKAGLAHAVRCLAWDYGHRIRFFIVHPYHVPGTPMGEGVVDAMMRSGRFVSREDAEEYQAKDLRLRERDGSPRELSAEEVAGHIVELVVRSDENVWLNGQSFPLYGGVR
jgi:NAD(P)-dependent dehydrogenase (short-subunit alcohol dehydrogenase family)